VFKSRSSRSVPDTTLCDKFFQWLVTGWWFCPVTPVSSTNKTDHHDKTEILMKVALNTITLTLNYWRLQDNRNNSWPSSLEKTIQSDNNKENLNLNLIKKSVIKNMKNINIPFDTCSLFLKHPITLFLSTFHLIHVAYF
jgi:hypothetical protein